VKFKKFISIFKEKPTVNKEETYDLTLLSKEEANNSILPKGSEEINEIKELSEELRTLSDKASAEIEQYYALAEELSASACDKENTLEKSLNMAKQLNEDLDNSMMEYNEMAASTQVVSEVAKDGHAINNNLKAIFINTTKASEEVDKEVEILSKNSEKISDITNVMKSITQQINLLSLNASIEAARAGDAGKGFGVVAMEVKKLANESIVSTSEINNILSIIKENIKNLNAKIQVSKELNVDTGIEIDKSSSSFDKINEAVSVLETSMEKVIFSLMGLDFNGLKGIISEAKDSEEFMNTSLDKSNSLNKEQAEYHGKVLEVSKKLRQIAEKLEQQVK